MSTTSNYFGEVYVSAYDIYNNSNLFGAWVQIDVLHESYEEFCARCTEAIKADIIAHGENVEDFDLSELMFQSAEGGSVEYFYDEASLEDYFEALDLCDWNADEVEKWGIYRNLRGKQYATYEDCQDNYIGWFKTLEDFAEEMAEQMGIYDVFEKNGISANYFDLDAYARDWDLSTWSSNGHYWHEN